MKISTIWIILTEKRRVQTAFIIISVNSEVPNQLQEKGKG